MNNCNCYHEIYGKSECWGTKEREPCSCNGDETKCNFYSDVRARAKAKKIDKEKIIKGLSACNEFDCKECPYQYLDDKEYPLRCIHTLVQDVYELSKDYKGLYEGLKEQGKLVLYPTYAYCIVGDKVCKGFVFEVTYCICRKPLYTVRYDSNSLDKHTGYLGLSVFLTKEEAEEKLKELQG